MRAGGGSTEVEGSVGATGSGSVTAGAGGGCAMMTSHDTRVFFRREKQTEGDDETEQNWNVSDVREMWGN